MGNDPESEAEPPRQDAQNSRPPHRRVGSDETERPHSAQQTQHDTDSHISETSEEESDEDDLDPAHRIDDFNWEDLHHRYHEAVKVCHGEEAALMEEWESLMTYFRIWAQSGHEHETDRTYSRCVLRPIPTSSNVLLNSTSDSVRAPPTFSTRKIHLSRSEATVRYP
ncbi:hypothetical protein GGP41_005440 [Bipolaris sorokiniana]|uniref:Uncharacterized protein n=1 Tax=Cochliobolus sativus TaxID=45130 RepID=A0A8H5ZKS7_COCSA|nr:hypothetical protein GGP41_005440 [Bipolaris sorokiniana]